MGPAKASLVVVDDEEATLEALALGLQADFSVRCAGNAMDALRMIREDRPELLLLDQAMPGGNGLWLLEQLRHDPRPVPVMLSAQADVQLARQALRLGAQDLLPKPCDLPGLIAALHAAARAGKQCLADEKVPFGLRAAQLLALAREPGAPGDLLAQELALAQALRHAAWGELPRDFAALAARLGL